MEKRMKMDPPVSRPPQELEEQLGHRFQDPGLLETALTHPSFAAEAAPPHLQENQRLEFLGDAVLGVVSAEWLLAQRPDWKEGTLTKVRSRLTNASTLAQVARGLELGAFLKLSRGEILSGGRDKGGLLADALEAVLGALWLDGGADAVREVFQKSFAAEIEEAVEAGGEDNPKGDLQERLHREGGGTPEYVVLEESGPAHHRHFKVRVSRGDEPLGEGEGDSKREAESGAARAALENLSPSV
jgi:ribonuclease III